MLGDSRVLTIGFGEGDLADRVKVLVVWQQG